MSLALLPTLALSGVLVLISFLAYGSQALFYLVEPAPLESRQAILFNLSVMCVLICYLRACFTSAGHVPSEWVPSSYVVPDNVHKRHRYCRKCQKPKPPRAHHCKTCQRCIPKMDHHCPWTVNCVSHRTFPHFIRFLFYAVVSMVNLEYFLFVRVVFIWRGRHLPSYLGPSPSRMVFLLILLATNSITLFALSILLIRYIWILGANTTIIEGWEKERHETLLRRAKVLGGYLDGPDGIRVEIRRQEFPFDIGILQNFRQGMGGSVFFWLWPLAATPSNQSGLQFKTNGFEDLSLSWPPPDPDRIPRPIRTQAHDRGLLFDSSPTIGHDYVEEFRRRQQQDQRRFHRNVSPIARRKPFYGRPQIATGTTAQGRRIAETPNDSSSGEEGWQNIEGERLDDFGVDEKAEFYDEDEIPLAVLRNQRRLQVSESNYPHNQRFA